MKKTAIFLMVGLAMLAAHVTAQQVSSDIIQVKYSRIYFGNGSEAGVYTGAGFTIICSDSNRITGTVAYAGPGISYSDPVADLDSLLIDTSCAVLITVSTVDSQATITLGTDIPMEMFDPEHEPLFLRTADTVLPNLVDSVFVSGKEMTLYLPLDLRFSDGQRFDTEALAAFMEDINYRSRSPVVRFFFTRLMPLDSGAIEIIDGFTAVFHFRHPFPLVAYYLSHPDFAVYNRNGNGTGPLITVGMSTDSSSETAYAPNPHYRDTHPAFARMVLHHYQQAHRMRYAFEESQIDGYFGFGFEAELAGAYQAQALYPQTAVMTAGLGSASFTNALFPTSLYYRFDPARAHLYFPGGEVRACDRWIVDSLSSEGPSRYFPFDFTKGQNLHQTILQSTMQVRLAYDNDLLYPTAQYIGDMAAREGSAASLHRYAYENDFDIRLSLYPASDEIIPFCLIAAVLELNDQNQTLPADERMKRPGWSETVQGSALSRLKNRNEFFGRAQEVVFEEGGFFPLYRPRIYAVAHRGIKNLDFDYYGYPRLDRVVKFSQPVPSGDM